MAATSYNYAYCMEYLPVRYSATTQQQNNRQEVYNFKNGYCSSRIKDYIIDKIKSIVGYSSSRWCVCFIPASTNSKTARRYNELAEAVRREIGCTCSTNIISNKCDRESGHLTGKKSNPSEDFLVDSTIRGKNVILIDDVITRGRTFVTTANKLENEGANSVVGLFVAKTINPDWQN